MIILQKIYVKYTEKMFTLTFNGATGCMRNLWTENTFSPRTVRPRAEKVKGWIHTEVGGVAAKHPTVHGPG